MSKQLELNFENTTPGPEATKPEPISPTFFQDIVSGPEKIKIEKKIATMGGNESDGAWKAHVARNQRYEAEQKEKEKLRADIKFGVENSSTPVSKAPQGSKKHKSDIVSYINKMTDMYDKKDEDFYPRQASPTQVGEVSKRLEESRQMSGQLSTWELMKETAKTPDERNEIKRILNKEYYKRGPKDMDQDDLKFIGKHKSQIVYPEINIPRVGTELLHKPTPQPEPQIPLRETIKILADKRLAKEQKKWDRENGRGGISDLMRPV